MIALFLNLAIQAKKQIHQDAAAKAQGDSASRDHLLKFWDAFPISESYCGVGKHSFAIRNHAGIRTRGQRPAAAHKPKDYSLQLEEVIDWDDDGL